MSTSEVDKHCKECVEFWNTTKEEAETLLQVTCKLLEQDPTNGVLADLKKDYEYLVATLCATHGH